MTRSRTPRWPLELTRLEDRTSPSDFPLFPRLPDGSLVYDGQATAVVTGPADADEFTLTLDADQTIAVEVTPNPLPASFRPTVARRAAVFGGAEGAASAVANGGFEFGDFTGWTTEITGNPFAP